MVTLRLNVARTPVLPAALATAMVVGVLVPRSANAEGKQGDLVQTDTVGLRLVNYTYDPPPAQTKTIADQGVLSEFVGLHYFFIDRVRLGMNLQFSEQLAPPVGPGNGTAFRTFAFLPQIGWDFWGPMFAAFVVTLAPWSSGTSTFEFGVQGVLGVGIPIVPRVKLTAAVEVPFTLAPDRAVALTPLLGVAIRL
jgi:hypothetical protein